MSHKTHNCPPYFKIIDWMVTGLELKNAELLVYALIYSFSRTPGTSFRGALQYLATCTQSSKSTMQRALRSLTNKGYIIKQTKKQNNLLFVNYRYSHKKLQELGIDEKKGKAKYGLSSYITIYSWMVQRMNLSSHKLTVFALLYSFTRSKQGHYAGNYAYIAERLNMSTKQAKRVIDELEKCGFISFSQKCNQSNKYMICRALNCDQVEQSYQYPYPEKNTLRELTTTDNGISKESSEITDYVDKIFTAEKEHKNNCCPFVKGKNTLTTRDTEGFRDTTSNISQIHCPNKHRKKRRITMRK